MSKPKFEYEQKYRFTRHQLVEALRLYTGRDDIPLDARFGVESNYEQDLGTINRPDAVVTVGWKTED
jgi:hypothetical protein